ncbi:VOC family protein [Gordonia amicalis]|uniref:VOC family protein n=1 Tax=Gordonia amicalis TaxID=89053 RepID=UPI001EDDA33F|nr:VOC family protein [Gordonia amicalis]MDJ0453929.1 VOC family protein [Gordonia amicalis]MDV7077074.1 VOC family protein [Gordonia amicalis]UKO92484.1 VOC family protein [Gordonia amicalis]
MQVKWLSAFLDFPADEFGGEVTFWRAISGSTVSPPRGEHREFASLEPFHGDPHLRVQRVDEGPGGVHLDIHTDDPHAAAEEAAGLGATLIHDADTHLVLRSPAGFVFCLVPWEGETTRSRPIRWPGDAISIIDQLCIDIPAPDFDAEVEFWTNLTGWPLNPPGTRPELIALRRDPSITIGILLQRRESGTTDDSTPATGHLDLATNSVPDEVARHEGWGARAVGQYPKWTTMVDPMGRPYCITSRNPRTGA